MAKILVVDDDPKILEIVEEILTTAGHDVSAADAPEKAFGLLRENPGRFDVILLDWKLRCPIDGDTVLKIIRHNFPSFTTPIVFVTAHSGIASKYLMRLGAFDVLTKPLTAPELVHAVEHALGKSPEDPDKKVPAELSPEEFKQHDLAKQIVDAITTTGSIKEAALKLNVSRQKIYRWLDATGLRRFFIEKEPRTEPNI
ncbi:MAG: response regulator [Nitrospirae bacterium]|nr:response regulator [Nitrospirota bacterium]